MTTPSLEGIIPILLTPFDEDGEIDARSLETHVEDAIEAGAHGLGIAIGSELFKLDEAERRTLLKRVVRCVGGRVPVVMNVGAQGTDIAIRHARAAEEDGADALMLFPPSFLPVGAAGTIEHIVRVASATLLPIVLQDIPAAPLPPAMAQIIGDRAETVCAVKVETLPTVPQVGAMVGAIGARMTVLGGAGGGTLIEEHRRGGRGTMPFASQTADFVALWDCLERDDVDGARTVFDARIAPIGRIAAQQDDLFYAVHKRLLVRRGIFRTAHVRGPTSVVDETTRNEIERVVDRYCERLG